MYRKVVAQILCDFEFPGLKRLNPAARQAALYELVTASNSAVRFAAFMIAICFEAKPLLCDAEDSPYKAQAS